MALIGSLNIGTPPQHFNVWFNQFINNTWILGNDAPYVPSTTGYERNVYFKDNSSTYQERNGTFEGFYGGGQNVSDVVSIPGTDLAARYTFGDSDGLTMFGKLIFMALPADGMVGIANSPSDTFLSAMQNQLEQKIVSIWTEGNVKGSIKEDAAITLGELNRHDCEAGWYFVPQTVTYAWTVNFTAVSVGGQKVGRSGVAMVVYSSILLTGPAKIVKPIIEMASAKLSAEGLYEVKCEKAHTLPDISFSFGDHVATLPATSYVFKYPLPKLNSPCVLGFQIGEQPPNFDFWVFGATFFNSHCVAYDWGASKIGFSASKKKRD